ncbi:hypothetical protein TcasGA2_TC016408 [Tribolium castaneum]|uniref:Uncharacterized protein n=1 Tax=Tribolium castaneum TaxID=7070 RepID=D7EIX3_TRICA|nr:hypothetical protein TcasGA2_TC016408 [Tribolium castaneum]
MEPANVMIGDRNSFFSRLKEDVPSAVLLRCICHSAALIVNKACDMLPSELEDLMREVYTYIGGSSKRCDQLKEMQEYFCMKHHKILKVSGTRWLSTHQCVERLLSNWEVLKAYFEIAFFEDKLNSANHILQKLKDPKIKTHFEFMKYALNYLNSFNALFQSKTTLIHSLQKESKRLLLQLCQNFIKPNVLKENNLNLSLIQPSNYLEIEHVYVGTDCLNILNTMNAYDQKEIRLNILKFYICAAQEMIKRLPINNNLFSELEFLLPKFAFVQSVQKLREWY